MARLWIFFRCDIFKQDAARHSQGRSLLHFRSGSWSCGHSNPENGNTQHFLRAGRWWSLANSDVFFFLWGGGNQWHMAWLIQANVWSGVQCSNSGFWRHLPKMGYRKWTLRIISRIYIYTSYIIILWYRQCRYFWLFSRWFALRIEVTSN